MSDNIVVHIDSWSIFMPIPYAHPATAEIQVSAMIYGHFHKADVLREAAKALSDKADEMDDRIKPVLSNAPMLGGNRRQIRERNRK